MIQPQYDKKDMSKEDPDFEIRKIYRHYTGSLYILLGFGMIDDENKEEQVIFSDVITGNVYIRPKNKFFDRHPQTNHLRFTPIEVINTREV